LNLEELLLKEIQRKKSLETEEFKIDAGDFSSFKKQLQKNYSKI